MAEHIRESFCTNKQNYVENDVGLGLKFLQEDETIVDTEEAEIILELAQTMKFMLSYKEKKKYLQDLNENLMIANKRLQNDLEEKEADYQKLVIIYKDTLKKKRAMQKT